MFKWWARIRLGILHNQQILLNEAIYQAIKEKDFVFYGLLKQKRAKNEAQYFKLKEKFSL